MRCVAGKKELQDMEDEDATCTPREVYYLLKDVQFARNEDYLGHSMSSDCSRPYQAGNNNVSTFHCVGWKEAEE
eukprot:jgi/Psemu1/14925/gm1.14925_g